MGTKNIIAGLEIGRTRVVLSTAQIRNGGAVDLLNTSKAKCAGGVKNGMIINLDKAAEAITEALEKVNQEAPKKVSSVFVNISGINLRTEIANSVITLSQRGCEITQKSVYDLAEACRIVSIPLDSRLLYITPLEYIIDGQDGIKNPLGLCGSKIEARFLVISAPFNQVQNIIKAVNFSGLEAEGVVLTALANCCSLLNEEDKREGVLLIDLKTDLTEVYIFKEGSLLFFRTIPKGQAEVTNEIADKLNVPTDVAEELKIKYGFLSAAQQADARNREAIPLGWMGRNQNIHREELNRIVNDRMGEIFDLISAAIKETGDFNNIVKKGAIVTGGAASMEGFLEWASSRLGFAVRQGLAQGADTASAVSFGLAKYGARKIKHTGISGNAGFFNKVINRAGELLSDYF